MKHKLLVGFKNSRQLAGRLNTLEREGWTLLFVAMWRQEYIAVLRMYVPEKA